MKQVNSVKQKSFSESLNSIENKFPRMTLDEQFAFMEWFKPFVADLKDEFRKFVVSQLCDYLEKEMNKNLVDWLESEFKN
jgi:hypothetical protein